MSHALISAYSPQGITEKDWGRIRSFVIDIAEKVVDDHACEQTIRKTLFSVSYLTDFFANRHFYPLTVEDIFNEDAIEFFVSECLAHRSPHSQATVRSQLRAIGRAVNPEWRGRTEERPYAATAKGAPYTDREIERLRWWAESQSGEYRKQSARLYLALTLGAGLRTKEVVTLTAGDVTIDDAGVIVHPHGYLGAEPRYVPVAAEWETAVASAATALSDTSWLFRPTREVANASVVATFLKRSVVPSHLVPDPKRLRTTWVVGHMCRGVPEPALLEAAGLADLQHYRPFMDSPATVTAEGMRDMLRGTREQLTQPHAEGEVTAPCSPHLTVVK